MELQFNEGPGKILAKCVHHHCMEVLFCIYFTLTGVKNIVHYTKDFGTCI